MKKNIVNNILSISSLAFVMVIASCTKLDTKLNAPNGEAIIEPGGAPQPSDLITVYQQLNQLYGQGNTYAMQEHTTDELMGPTRGTDWDDFGTWRKLHLHTWDGAHNQINDSWNGLNQAIFQTTLLAEATSADEQTKAEAIFLRAYFSYLTCDMFGQLQHRPATAAIDVIPDVYNRGEAIDFIISELEKVIPKLPSFTRARRDKATKEAAQFLLAKCYLNKSVYKKDPSSPGGPYTFAAADMNKVVELANAISANAEFKVADYYWDNFTWENGAKSTENIFVRNNESGGNNTVWATCMGNHYSMTPDGWNGFTTLADFYNSFDDADVRKRDTVKGTIVFSGSAKDSVPAEDSSIYWNKATKSSSYIRLTGRPAGFLVGQQRGPSYKDKKYIGLPVNNLKDRAGNPLVFTPGVSLFFSTESKGIRTNKYPLDPRESNGGGWGSKNEFVFFRFSDLRLMKAEAILRGGTDAESALSIINEIRAKRNVTNLGEASLTALLAERGRELYLEAWRRNDLIRFGKFNDPVNERAVKSDGTRVVFPIPLIALSSNPNLKQNSGY